MRVQWDKSLRFNNLDWFQSLEPYFASGSYLAVFLVLLLCGIGLPIPEEITFIVAGYVVGQLDANIYLMIAVALVGIIAGDSLTYWLGRWCGIDLLKKWPFCKILGEKGIERSKEFFRAHGSKTIFTAGFLAGVRAPTFFLSGVMGVSYIRFCLLDLSRAVVTCPVSIFAGYYFGPGAEKFLSAYKLPILCMIGCMVLYLLLRWYIRKRRS